MKGKFLSILVCIAHHKDCVLLRSHWLSQTPRIENSCLKCLQIEIVAEKDPLKFVFLWLLKKVECFFMFIDHLGTFF